MVIQGWYGNGNLGDEIILECILAGIRKEFPNASFLVVSDNPEDTRRRHGVESITRGGGRVTRLRRLLALMEADLFILGGGGLLKPYGSSELSVLTWLGPLNLADEMKVPTMAYAVGVSDGFSPRVEAVIKSILNRTDVVLVRDNQSLALLRDIGVPMAKATGDPSLLLKELYPEANGASNKGTRPIVTVFLNHWYVRNNQIPDMQQWIQFKASLAGALDGLVSRNGAWIKFIPMQLTNTDDDDRVVAREVRGLMAHGEEAVFVDREVTPRELLEAISGSDLVIGMRLHSLIIAASLGVPSVAIDYQVKVRRFSDEIGAPDWVVGIGDASTESIELLATKALHGGYPLSMVKNKVRELQELARDNARSATSLIQSEKRGNHLVPRLVRGTGAVLRRLIARNRW